MSTQVTVRSELPGDLAAIRAVVDSAFGRPQEGQLVDALREQGYARLALVAEAGDEIVGYVLFSDLAIVRRDETTAALALAPVAVVPACQRQGLGSRLIREGLRRAAEAGHRIVIVLGHREYYPRFGFSSALARPLDSPYAGDSFMALELAPGALEGITGAVKYPPPFDMF